MNTNTVLSLARKHLSPANGSANACMADVVKAQNEGRYGDAIKWALRSLAYSVGISHPDYRLAFAASGISGEVRLISMAEPITAKEALKPETVAADKIWSEFAAARVTGPKHLAEIIAEAFKGERARAALLRQALNHLHAKAQEDCEVFFEQDGKPIELSTNLGEAYAESDLCDKVNAALTADDETALRLLAAKGQA